MALARFTLENYRCFRTRQDLELRPITVVLGKNNSGKSAVVRAPMILETGVSNRTPVPFDLDRLGDNAPDFVDLVHNRLDHGSLTVGLEFRGPDVHIEATIQNVDEWHTQVISHWSMRTQDDTVELVWLQDDTDDDQLEMELAPHSEGRTYRLIDTSGNREQKVCFGGLLPLLPSHDGLGRYLPKRSDMDRIRYLGPFRARPTPYGRAHGRPPAQDESGSRTTNILVTDFVRQGGRLADKINEYLVSHLPDWRLQVEPRYEGVSVGLASTRDQRLWVPINDVGTGVAQVLPILVNMARDELAPRHSPAVLEIVEEPELHLHPSAQADLAELYIAAIKRTSTRYLIETHSETFLLRLRRRVAERSLDPANLALYFVESDGTTAEVRRIHIDELGNVDYWPEGIFSEDFEEVRALAAAQTERMEFDAG